MSYEEGLKDEQSGDYFSALSTYRQELDSDRLTKDVLRGLFRATLKVGDIHALSLDLLDLCKSTGISSASAQLMQGRLLVEIGENQRARDIACELDSKFFGVSENLELELLRANMLALDFRFDEAIELLKKSDQVSPNHLRRIAELELAAQRPESVVIALKSYVRELNKKNKLQGSNKRFITASGFLFNLANQMWLEQKFPQVRDLPSLSYSMKMLQEISRDNFEAREQIFDLIPGQLSNPAPDCVSQNSTRNQMVISNNGTLNKRTPENDPKSSLDSLIRFVDDDFIAGEFSRIPLEGWELRYKLPPNIEVFSVEESGLPVWTNFKLSAERSLIFSWSEHLKESKQIAKKGHFSHSYPSVRLTQLLARELEFNPAHSPKIILRNIMRRGRHLSRRYTT
jgi:hypothetical protein